MMKQKITFKLLLAVMLMAFCGGSVWAQTTYTHEFAKGDLSNGSVTLGGVEWTFQMEGSTYLGWDTNVGRGLQMGSSGSPAKTITLSTSGIPGAITEVKVNTCGASGVNGTFGVSVASTAYGEDVSLTKTATEYTFTGSATGAITLNWTNKTKKAIYIKSISVTYADGGTTPDPEPQPEVTPQTLAFAQETLSVTNAETEVQSPALTGAKTKVTYASSNVGVAEVNNEGLVTIKGIGSSTITATAAAGVVDGTSYSEGSASYTLTVVDPNATSVTFDFSDPAFVKSLGLVDHQKIGTFTYCGFTVEELAGGNGVKLWGSEIRHYGSSSFKITAPDDCVIVSVKFDEGSKKLSNTDDDATSHQVYTINKPSTVFVNEGKSQVRYKKVVVDFAKQTSYALNITEAGYATFAANEAYAMPAGLKGGIVTVANGVAKVDYMYTAGDVVAAKEALLIAGAAGDYTLNISAEEGVRLEGNLLKGAFTNDEIKAAAGNEIFVLAQGAQGLGFYWQKDRTDGAAVSGIANKAYLELPIAAGVNGLRLVDGEATGIEGVETVQEDAAIYTLAGVRVTVDKNNLPKGLYIINGKKVLVK